MAVERRTIGLIALFVAAAGGLAYIAFGGDDRVDRTPVVRSAPTRVAVAPPPPPPVSPVAAAEPAPDPAAEAGPCGAGMEAFDDLLEDGTRARGCGKRVDGNRLKQGRWTLSDAQGFTMNGEYVDGLREGRWTAWYKSGVVFQYVDFIHDKKEGTWVQWTEDRRKVFERSYRNDVLDGPSTIYFADGGYEVQNWRNGERVP